MKEFENWQVNLEDKILWARLNRPEKKNAFDPATVDELAGILQEVGKLYAHRKPRVRVMVLSTVMDEIFSSGADIKWFSTIRTAHDGEYASAVPQQVFGAVERAPVPVIAAVKGLNLTAGFELMMCCDLIIVADNAKLGQIETKYALTPFGGGTQRLTRLVGPLKARELIYTAKIVSAQEALAMGLVNEVVPLGQIDARVKEIAAKIIEKSPTAIRNAKQLIDLAIWRNELGFVREGLMAGQEFASKEPMEYVMKFLEKSRAKKE